VLSGGILVTAAVKIQVEVFCVWRHFFNFSSSWAWRQRGPPKRFYPAETLHWRNLCSYVSIFLRS